MSKKDHTENFISSLLEPCDGNGGGRGGARDIEMRTEELSI